MSSTSSHQELSPPPLKRRKVSPSTTILEESELSFTTAEPRLGPSDHIKHPVAVYSWNINGITPFLPPATLKITNFLTSPPKDSSTSHPSLRACLQKWSWPHIVCLQEVKIARSDTHTQSHLKRAINTPLDAYDNTSDTNRLYSAHFSLPRDPHNATGFKGKVHGVCTLIRQDLLVTPAWNLEIPSPPPVTTEEIEWDLEGRVLLSLIHSHALAVFNIYAVNGTDFAYRSPHTGRVVGTRHDRKRAFHSLLASHVRALEGKGWEVLVIGDINIARTKADSFPELRMGRVHVENRADFEGKFFGGQKSRSTSELGEKEKEGKGDDDARSKEVGHHGEQARLDMTDAFRHLHGDKRKSTYRPTHKPWGAGGDRVDMALVTRGLVNRVEEADILDTEEDRSYSDHVPLFVKMAWET